jgi:ribose transport system substrate-binding protein
MLKSKKIAAALAVAALALTPGAQAQQQPKKIGLAVANLQAEFFNMIKQSVEAYGKEKGYQIITVDAKGDATTQVNQIRTC